MSQEETSMQSKSIKSTYRGLLAGACFATLLVAGAAGSAFAADYAPVTDARLANPEPENWLMTRGKRCKGRAGHARDQQGRKARASQKASICRPD
jgi:hypothetical protein